MSGFLAGLLRPFAVPLAAGGGVLVTFILMWTYNSLIENPSVVREARKQYIALVEYEELSARLEAERKFRKIAQSAVENYAAGLEEINRQHQAEAQKAEQEISDYEIKLADTNRRCLLDDADVKWLLRN